MILPWLLGRSPATTVNDPLKDQTMRTEVNGLQAKVIPHRHGDIRFLEHESLADSYPFPHELRKLFQRAGIDVSDE